MNEFEEIYIRSHFVCGVGIAYSTFSDILPGWTEAPESSASKATASAVSDPASATHSGLPFPRSSRSRFTVIIDAGHGGEDPGAVVGQIEEKTLNLSISNKLYAFASLFDVDIVMTRRDDRMLYDEGQETRKKSHDLYNRLKFTEKYTDSMFISIHQNKFPLENCRGLQVFYALKNENSKVLAEHVQNAALLLQPDNHRVVKPGTNIYLLENSTVPSVIVECGFISNPEEAQQLCDDNYTDKLAFAIYCGIAAYLEDVKIEG